ncbi:MAG: methyltransferase [Deltaproteobacteria bacterium]|nr:methyltransferase [Deltaproteobacteria bacterium]
MLMGDMGSPGRARRVPLPLWEETTDVSVDFLPGLLELEQPRRGYRFNTDAILLAAFVSEYTRPATQVADLGAGCGVVGLLMAREWPDSTLTLVELQPVLAALCARNIERNGLDGRVEVMCSDLREGGWRRGHGRLLALCNPPFFPVGRARLSKDQQLALARHELCLTLAELLEASGGALEVGEELALVHLAARSEEIFAAFSAAGFGALRYRQVRSLPHRKAQRILVVATKGEAAENRHDLGDLIINSVTGGHSAEVQAWLDGRR